MSWMVHPAASLFPVMAGDELKQLAADVGEHGLHEPVWLWRDGDGQEWLLDGRNRVAACEIAGVDVTTQQYHGDDPISFIMSLNLFRRHLTAGQRAFLALALEPMYAEQAKKRMLAGVSNPPADLQEGSRYDRESNSKAGKATGTSGRAVSQAKRIRDKAPDLATKVELGDAPGGISLNRAERIFRNRDAERRRDERAKAEAAATETVATIDVRLGDFRDVLADLTNVDAIITDPPYGKEFLPLLGDLARWSDEALAPNGVMAVLMGQTYLDDVFRLLSGGRPYRWTACYLFAGPSPDAITGGSSYFSHARRVNSNWKPLLVYGGGERVFSDVFRSEGSDAAAKNNHRWGQDFGAFSAIIQRLTEPGQTVVDPFMGGGTPLLAAHALGRHVIGCDVDPQAVATARRRLGIDAGA
jgi:DNA methylase